uniref:GON domain-containing protein n=1 Tax=Branchiostoma floridae TaxID=7739 RepID=C3YRP3_BRAFL|eukprot:XP_002600786.1 hypothetical protein BRAFLDRAFT_95072 [Branchiostoma floridae]
MGVLAVIFLGCAVLLAASSPAERNQKQADLVADLENRILRILEAVDNTEPPEEQQRELPQGPGDRIIPDTAVDGMKPQQDVRELLGDIFTRTNTGSYKSCAASCSHIKLLNPTAEDGEYTLFPFPNNVPLRVYCHDMASENPKEFLSLPSGPDENYAIVFPDRLTDASGGQCTGPLQQPYTARAGTTKFSKLRIKVENCRVEVIRDDYTFAETTGPNKIDFGHAGDCYSWKQGCAKGMFKVDLTGTELALAPDVEWTLEERYPASLTINDMVISDDRKNNPKIREVVRATCQCKQKTFLMHPCP